MKILLANTGRGGEQCIFSSIVHSYRLTFPGAEIRVLTCPQYEGFWANNQDISSWQGLEYEDLDPVSVCYQVMDQAKEEGFDLVEYPCECQSSAKYPMTSTLERCYWAIKKRPFPIDYVERKVFIYPTEEEVKEAYRLAGMSMILLSPGANCAESPLSVDGFTHLAQRLQDHGEVFYTRSNGRPHMPKDPYIENAVALVDLPYGVLYALAPYLKLFVGLDTATSWIVSGMAGTLITLRGDPSFPLWNTGLVEMGYRDTPNTWELEMMGASEPDIIDGVLTLVP